VGSVEEVFVVELAEDPEDPDRGLERHHQVRHRRALKGEKLVFRNVKRFQGGLVFKAHRLFYHSTLGLRVIKKKKRKGRGKGKVYEIERHDCFTPSRERRVRVVHLGEWST